MFSESATRSGAATGRGARRRLLAQRGYESSLSPVPYDVSTIESEVSQACLEVVWEAGGSQTRCRSR